MSRDIVIEGDQYTGNGTEEYVIEGMQVNEDQAVAAVGLDVPVIISMLRKNNPPTPLLQM